MENTFEAYMSQQTDKQLEQVLVLRDDYQPEAVKVAEAEIKKRKNFSEYFGTLEEQQLIEIVEMATEYWPESVEWSIRELRKRGSRYILERDEKEEKAKKEAEEAEAMKLAASEEKEKTVMSVSTISQPKECNKYPALHTISFILSMNAILVIFAMFIVFAYMMSTENWLMGFISLVAGGLLALLYWALAELIKLFMDIERNTRK